MAIAEMAISERTPPDAGIISGTALNGTHLAVATAATRFMVLERAGSSAGVAEAPACAYASAIYHPSRVTVCRR